METLNFDLKKAFANYKKEIGKEPYQPLSALINKLKLCASK